MYDSVESFMRALVDRDPNQPEFHQAVHEVVESLWDFVKENPDYQHAKILERLVEPERVITFRVAWRDDRNETQVNRGYRVEYSSAIGPYKGGLRFHPSVNLGILKFLGFEQILKNSLTGLPMGGGKGGSDFDPKGKSDSEVMSFCQAFMTELARHIGPDTDVPAGDIGVGAREIGFLYGQYRRIRNEVTSVLTGKSLSYGGSLIRPEATGYGCVYFAREMLSRLGESFKGKRVTISGSGNVAQYAAEKVIELGGKVVTLSDSSGTIYDPHGIDSERLAWVMQLKNKQRGRIRDYTTKYSGSEYREGKRPWDVPCDIALPSATQNEIEAEDARNLVKNGCKCVAEGANMPTHADAVEIFQQAKILFGPGKAANAGGVAVSGLEMSQNAMRLSWTREEVDKRLHDIMVNIHNVCVKYGSSGGDDTYVDYVKGANIGGFRKVADAMLEQGVM